MNVYPKYPIGTDPDAMDRLIEDGIARRGYVPGPGTRQQQGVRPARDRPAIFNKALLKAVSHKEAPPEVKAALTTDDGVELQIVGDNDIPEIYDETRRARDDE